MSGFEVVGVVLGVLPLIISAIEHYNDIVDPIRTCRKYSSALQTLVTDINAQRDIFQNECILILSQFVNQHALEDMLKDPKHALRSQLKYDQNVQEKVTSLIGSHASQLQGILKLINDSLDEIYEEIKHLPDGLERPQRDSDEAIDMKAWRSLVRQRLKLSFRKDYLNQKINDLRNRNQTFLALCQQIVRFNASWAPTRTQSETQSTEKALGKVQKLRTTAQMLYRHLEKLSNCSNHAEHSANIRLYLETNELYVDAPPKISFEIAIIYCDVEQSAIGNQEPILLAIESIDEKATVIGEKSNAFVRFTDSQPDQSFRPAPIQRQKSADIKTRDKAKEAIGRPSNIRSFWKKVKGGEPSTIEPLEQTPPKLVPKPAPYTAAYSSPVAPPEPIFPDLSSANNLCTLLSGDPKPSATSDNPTTPPTNNCIGYLGRGTDKYKVYRHPSPSPQPPFPSTLITLSSLILTHRRQQYLPKPDKWRLAGALSLAVLLYHSTPWLRPSLQSSDILFFHRGGREEGGWAGGSPRPSLKQPHLHCVPHHDTSSYSTKKAALTLASDGHVKNAMLYHLGLILLELEFEDTLESLAVEATRDSGFAANNDNNKNNDKVAAALPLPQQCLLLKRRAGTQLGTLYGRIVRMCLDCDFGLGLEEYDLADGRVQRVFYERVVRGFQERMPEFERIWEGDW